MTCKGNIQKGLNNRYHYAHRKEPKLGYEAGGYKGISWCVLFIEMYLCMTLMVPATVVMLVTLCSE